MLSQILVTCWQRFYAVPYSIYYTSYYKQTTTIYTESLQAEQEKLFHNRTVVDKTLFGLNTPIKDKGNTPILVIFTDGGWCNESLMHMWMDVRIFKVMLS